MQPGVLIRSWEFAVHAGLSSTARITVDASPWGMGAVLEVDSTITQYFSLMLTEDDVAIHGYPIGSPDGQQVWELLAALVALRHWGALWHNKWAVVRGDNVATLYTILHLRPHSCALRRLARELALEFALVG
eukprot:6490072-Amphidinium_carterae.1